MVWASSDLLTEILGALVIPLHDELCFAAVLYVLWFILHLYCVAVCWGGRALQQHTGATKGPRDPWSVGSAHSKQSHEARGRARAGLLACWGPPSWQPCTGRCVSCYLVMLQRMAGIIKTQANDWPVRGRLDCSSISSDGSGWSLSSAPEAVSWW